MRVQDAGGIQMCAVRTQMKTEIFAEMRVCFVAWGGLCPQTTYDAWSGLMRQLASQACQASEVPDQTVGLNAECGSKKF